MKLKEQTYIFSRSLGVDKDGCEWLEQNIDTYKGMMKRKEMRKKYPLNVFKITPLYYEGETYKQDPLNTKQLKLI
tara:strand:+ start:745 stop:969 length:225 start_codon:yes stop_codon:yes gene_type:complete